MGSVFEYNTTAGNNSQTGGGVSVAEGMNATNVNNAMRDIMADLAKWRDVIGGSKTAGGAADALTLSTGVNVSTYADGQMYSFVASADNTGAATLNVDSVGVKAIRKNGDAALSGGEIVTGAHYIVQYDASANSAAGAFLLLNPTFGTFGTSATYDIGTSGGTVPLLNGNNTYSGTSAFTGAATFTTISASTSIGVTAVDGDAEGLTLTNTAGESVTFGFASASADAAFRITYTGGTAVSLSDTGVLTVKDIVITG